MQVDLYYISLGLQVRYRLTFITFLLATGEIQVDLY